MAKEVNEIRLKYRCGVKSNKNSEIKEYEYDYITVSTSATKRYNNAVCLLMGINGCAHHLIEWLSDNMSNGGYVNNNVITRRAFISFYGKWKKSNKSYGEDSVNKAFKKLSDEGFLIPINKGTYQINPMMYFSADDEARIKSIKYMMEFKSGVETKITMEVNKK